LGKEICHIKTLIQAKNEPITATGQAKLNPGLKARSKVRVNAVTKIRERVIAIVIQIILSRPPVGGFSSKISA
jgi:hypothetical protein